MKKNVKVMMLHDCFSLVGRETKKGVNKGEYEFSFTYYFFYGWSDYLFIFLFMTIIFEGYSFTF